MQRFGFFLLTLGSLLFSVQAQGGVSHLASRDAFSLTSVAYCEDARDVVLNPALMAMSQGFSGLFYHQFSDSSFEGENSLFLSAGGLGFAAQGLKTPQRIDYRSYTLSLSGRSGDHFYTGLSYTWKRSSSYLFDDYSALNLGLLYRPCNLLSFGGVARNLNRPRNWDKIHHREFDLGLAIRPFTTRLTLSVDGRMSERESIKDMVPIYGLELEPIDGLFLKGSRDGDGNLGFGVQLNLTTLGGGLIRLYDKDSDYQGGATYLRLSQERYRTFLRKKHQFVELKLSGQIVDERPGGIFGRKGLTTKGLLDVIEKAKRDRSVDGIILRVDPLSAGWGKIQEIRDKLLDFRSAGKKVVCYMETGGNLEYYLAAVSDMIVLCPGGDLFLVGLKSEIPFIKGTLEKLGIKADLEHIGEYKSASDLLTRDSMSDAHREVINSILDDYYDQLTEAIAEGRGLQVDEVKGKIDRGPYMAKGALKADLVDTLAYYDQVEDIAKKLTGRKIHKLKVKRFAKRKERRYEWGAPPKIAIIYGSGTIWSGESGYNPLPIPLIGGKYMGSETIARAIRRARKDKSIKAIVFRIDSGGGSGLASDVIWREVNLAQKEKPFIVSMSDVAGSGGYYIACAADTIVAEPMTITGSIGVISGKFDMREFYNKIGLRKEVITRGENADIYTNYRGFSAEERRKVKLMMKEFYDDFVNKVAQGRGISYEDVDAIGRGRIWTGRQAKTNGLVDELGGLERAIDIAKAKAGIDKKREVKIVTYPRYGYFTGLTDLIYMGGLKENLPLSQVWRMKEHLRNGEVLYLMPYLPKIE